MSLVTSCNFIWVNEQETLKPFFGSWLVIKNVEANLITSKIFKHPKWGVSSFDALKTGNTAGTADHYMADSSAVKQQQL